MVSVSGSSVSRFSGEQSADPPLLSAALLPDAVASEFSSCGAQAGRARAAVATRAKERGRRRIGSSDSAGT
jgi:hypothetical protein